MTGWWVASFLALWGVVALTVLLLVGVLRQMGQLRLQLGSGNTQPLPEIPSIESDGPVIGSYLPQIVVDTANNCGTVDTDAIRDSKQLLVMFLSPMCDTCQHAVDLLNSLSDRHGETVQALVIMRADELACKSFQKVFPLRVPLICDTTRKITSGFDVHRNPFGLLYDRHGVLVRKGIVTSAEHLSGLLGDPDVPGNVRSDLFPRTLAGTPDLGLVLPTKPAALASPSDRQVTPT